jgi:4-amino-4-deoxy-L-arabinose transferase-like glycosyltransferase
VSRPPAERNDIGSGAMRTATMGMTPSRMAERGAVVLALVLYVICFVALPPRVLSVADEGSYVRQSQALAEGRLTIEKRDPHTGARLRALPSSYPIGTSALQVPFVWVGGWRAAAAASVLSLITAVLVLMHWLEREGKSPLFALVVLGFPPALFMGRIAMSDAPSMALTTLGLFFFFRANGASFRDWFIAGSLAGISFVLRESNPLVFVVLFAGAVVRRDRNWPALLLGGVLGGSLRPLTAFLIMGDLFFVRSQAGSILSLSSAAHNVALYAFALLVMVPGGLAAAVAY